jgi:hypothetical protein
VGNVRTRRWRKLRATIDDVHLDIYLPYESQLGGKLRLEAHITTKMAALLDRYFSAKGQKDAREILALLKLEDIDPSVPADQKLIVATKRSWESELQLRATSPQGLRPRL